MATFSAFGTGKQFLIASGDNSNGIVPAVGVSGTVATTNTSVQTASSVVIANGATDSAVFTNAGYVAGALLLPGTFTGANISFKGCLTVGGTYQLIYDLTGALITFAVTQGRNYPIPGEVLAYPFWKIISDASEGGARTIGLALNT